MATVLVTDGEQRSALAVVRSLGEAGHRVVVVGATKAPLAGASRYAARTYGVPPAGAFPDLFAEAVLELVRQEDVDVLIPMTDVAASVLLPRRHEVPGLKVPFADVELYDAVSDKQKLMDVARSLGVPVPDQHVARAPDDVEAAVRWAESTEYPVVLKPARSAVVTDDGVQDFGVRIVASPEQLAEGLAAYPPAAYPVLVQERIVGPGLGAFILSKDGRTVARFAHKRLREKPPTGGVSVYRESVELRADVAQHAETILRHLEWTGVAMVEFKEDAATGTPYLMEINARFWGSLQLAIDAGVDFPTLLMELTQGEEPQAVEHYRLGVRTRWLWGDVDHLLTVLFSRSRAGSDILPSRARAIGRFLRLWWPGDRFEVLRLSDPRPFLRESAAWLRALRG